MYTDLPDDTRDRILDQMNKQHISRKEMAKRLGINETSFGRYLKKDTIKLSTENIIAMAKELHVTTDYLLGLTKESYMAPYQIEKLGLTLDSAKKLASGDLDMDIVNMILPHPDFEVLVTQMGLLRDAVFAEAIGQMNAMINSLGLLIKSHVRQNPGQKDAAKAALRHVKAARQPKYEADMAAIDATFHHLLSEIKAMAKEKIEQSEKANSTNLNEVFSKLQEKTGDPLNKQNLTSDILADTIMEVVMKPYDMPQENAEKMRNGILAALDFFKDYGKEDESKAAEESAS